MAVSATESAHGITEQDTTDMYDPTHPDYLDEATVRLETARTFDVCAECRRCVDYCGVFPSLFELVDQFDDIDAGRLTPAQQDDVLSQCFHCTRCADGCPNGPKATGVPVDVPRLGLRAAAMRRANGHTSGRERIAAGAAVRLTTGGVGSSAVRALAARTLDATPGSGSRRLANLAAGVASERVLPPRSRQRFTTWFERRSADAGDRPAGGRAATGATVGLFPTCMVDRHAPEVGRSVVGVYEHIGAQCELAGTSCCGAPLLDAGDVDGFVAIAKRNVKALLERVRAGGTVVVAQSTCAHVLRNEYPRHLPGPEAELVASNTFDVVVDVQRRIAEMPEPPVVARPNEVDEGAAAGEGAFGGGGVAAPGSGAVVVHASCRDDGAASAAASLLRASGATVNIVSSCSGVGGGWGYRSANQVTSVGLGQRLAENLGQPDDKPVVVGGCHLANTAIGEFAGRRARHPIEVLADRLGLV